MKNRINRKNQLLGLLVMVGLAGTGYEVYHTHAMGKVNQALLSGEVVNDERYAFHKKFADAYQQGQTANFKMAVQGFGQLLEAPKKQQENVFVLTPHLKSQIQFNIANNLFRSGLQRLVHADGTIHEEALYAYQQAKPAFEQALKLEPSSQAAKFNLSLLLSVLPKNIKAVAKEQSGMEISNLPQGLP